MFRLLPSHVRNPSETPPFKLSFGVPPSYPIYIPSESAYVETFTPINGLAPSLAKSELSAMTGFVLPLVPTLSVLLAYASWANKISVATESNSSPNASQSDDDGDGCPNEPDEIAFQKFISGSGPASVNSQTSILAEDETYVVPELYWPVNTIPAAVVPELPAGPSGPCAPAGPTPVTLTLCDTFWFIKVWPSPSITFSNTIVFIPLLLVGVDGNIETEVPSADDTFVAFVRPFTLNWYGEPGDELCLYV